MKLLFQAVFNGVESDSENDHLSSAFHDFGPGNQEAVVVFVRLERLLFDCMRLPRHGALVDAESVSFSDDAVY